MSYKFSMFVIFSILLISTVHDSANGAKPTEIKPDKVTGLASTATSISQIELSWIEPDDNGSPITGYKIERRSNGPWTVIMADTTSTSTSYTDTGLAADTTYQYRVSAINSEGTGQASTTSSATTLSVPTVPSKPKSLDTVVGDSFVTLTWEEPKSDGGEPIIDYVIEISKNNGDTWMVVDDGLSINTEFTVTDLDNYVVYLFRVYAINSVGYSPYAQTGDMPLSDGTDKKDSRSSPKILGYGFYQIFTEVMHAPYSKIALGLDPHAIDSFNKFIPYSQHSDKIDLKKFNGIKSYDKHGQYVDLEDFYIIPTFTGEIGKTLQIQIRLEDEYKGSKIEHVGFYTGTNDGKIDSSKIKLIWNKGHPLDIIDPEGFLENAEIYTSLENDVFWAILYLEFDDELPKSDMIIEAWNELRRPSVKVLDDSIQIKKHIEFSTPDIPLLHQEVEATHDTSNPVCKVSLTCFTPHNAKIRQGGIISWTNTDMFLHDVESGTSGNPTDRFDLHLMPGETGQIRFDFPGVYNYFCKLHPWATGLVTVVSNDVTPNHVVYDDKSVLLISSQTAGGSVMIENRDTVVIPNKDLAVEISGYIQEKKGKQPIAIMITRPDGTEQELKTQTNDRGYYFIPSVLDTKWQSGNYNVSVFFKNKEIGSLQFSITDTEQVGFGGKIGPMRILLENQIRQVFENKSTTDDLIEWLKEKNLSSDSIEYLQNRILFFEQSK
ncbi:MAG: fibronectin type III domain-containing protein [Candidatus Nitrosomaritimum yanchengensis]